MTRLSTIVEYAINEQVETVQQVWQYGQDRRELYSGAWSGVTWMPETNNRLMVPAWAANPKVEVTEDREVVFEFLINTTRFDPRWYHMGRINGYPDTKE
jgi:hypothetical protein